MHVNSAFNIFEINCKYFGLNYFRYNFVIFILSEKCYAEDDSNTESGSFIILDILDNKLSFLGDGELVN